ncbi:MAG: fused MFS/spermidine synthase [Firmicutes bacterium]|nr:fused MFS/spermidine synthase [Bacillota bacterium]
MRTAILLCFFLSGAAGLVYQVAWSKALGLVFGHTVYAIATVLAVFMAGLAAGSAVLGRWCEQKTKPVSLYGWIELLIAGLGAASLAGLVGVRWLYRAAFPLLADVPALLVLLRVLGAALVLFLPTFLMGGTLPVLVRGLTRHSAELGVRIGRLYWVNTAGAVAGTLAAGFLLLPALGLKRTVGVAVVLNVLAGLAALVLDWRLEPVERQTAPENTRTKLSWTASGWPWRLLASFAAVGATAMAYEIAWTRLLGTMLGSSTYTFTLTLAVFLAGLVLGGFLFERWTAQGGQPNSARFATTQLLTAVAALGFLASFELLAGLVPPILRAGGGSFTGLVLAQFTAAGLTMLPTAVVFGFNFPLVVALMARLCADRGHAEAVGRAYAANTIGAIGGALLTGFWLLPAVGAFRTVVVAATGNLALALLLELQSRPRRPLALATTALLLAVAVGVSTSGAFYNRALTTFGTVLYWDLYQLPLSLTEVAETTDVVYAEDGLNASVAVVRTENYLALRTNGKVDASNQDTLTQLLVGHLGLWFHPSPRRVLVVGLGSGMTVSAVARHAEVEQIDCVEIEPAVIRAAAYLSPLHRGVLSDPRLRLIADDARNFLLTTRERYDVIISEPSNPWIAGVASLFTRDFYAAVRQRLHPGGIFVQWVQGYALEPDDVRSLLATALLPFPRATLWRAETYDYLLLAQTQDEPLRLDRLRALWSRPEMQEELAQLELTQPEGLLAYHRLDDAALRRLAAGAAIQTDDHPRLEYRAPRALLRPNREEKIEALIDSYREALLSRDIVVEQPEPALLAMARTLLGLREYDAAQAALAALPATHSSAEAELLRGRLALHRHAYPAARAALERALQLDPSRLEAAYALGELAQRQLQLERAELFYRQVVERNPQHVEALRGLARVEQLRERWNHAIAWQRRVVEAAAVPSAEDLATLGALLIRIGSHETAEAELQRALQADPYSYLAHRNLAELYRHRQNWAQSRQHLETVVRYFPERDPSAYAALVEVCRRTGDFAAARAARRKALRLFPDHPDVAAIAPIR